MHGWSALRWRLGTVLLSLWYLAQTNHAYSAGPRQLEHRREGIPPSKKAPEACIMYLRYQSFLWGDENVIQQISERKETFYFF
jgi:hypothetical protein